MLQIGTDLSSHCGEGGLQFVHGFFLVLLLVLLLLEEALVDPQAANADQRKTDLRGRVGELKLRGSGVRDGHGGAPVDPENEGLRT